MYINDSHQFSSIFSLSTHIIVLSGAYLGYFMTVNFINLSASPFLFPSSLAFLGQKLKAKGPFSVQGGEEEIHSQYPNPTTIMMMKEQKLNSLNSSMYMAT